MATWTLKRSKYDEFLAASRRANISGPTRISSECGISKSSATRILKFGPVRDHIMEPVFVRILGFEDDGKKRTTKENSELLATMNEFCDKQAGDDWEAGTVREATTTYSADRLTCMSVYAKVLTLRDRARSQSAYRKFVPRLQREIEVFDEVVVLRSMLYRHVPKNVRVSGDSSGVVDLQPILPLREIAISNKVHNTESPQKIEHFERQPGQPLVQVALTYYNGLQHPNERIGFVIPEDCDEVAVVVDMTSLPVTADVLFEGRSLPVVLHIRIDAKGQDVTHKMECRRSDSGAFIISSKEPGTASDTLAAWDPADELLKDDRIEVQFAFNWSVL